MAITAVFAAINILLMVVPVVALIHAARAPSDAFDAAGQDRTLWLVLLALAIFVPIVGPVLGIVYLTAIRGRLRNGALV